MPEGRLLGALGCILGRGESDGKSAGSALPGVLAYGATAAEARGEVNGLALRVIAHRIELATLPGEAQDWFSAA